MADAESIEFTIRPKGSANANIDNTHFKLDHEARGFTGLQALDVSGQSETHCHPFTLSLPSTSALACFRSGPDCLGRAWLVRHPSLVLIYHRDTLIFFQPLLLERIC